MSGNESYPFTFVSKPHGNLLLEPPGRGRGRGRGRGGRGRGRGKIRVGASPQLALPGNWLVSPDFPGNYSHALWNFEARPGDVWIVTPPKCGTTWMQELVWLLMNNLDYETARNVNQFYRSPFVEFGSIFDDAESPSQELASLEMSHENLDIFMGHSLEFTTQMAKDPRLIKTHLPIALLSPRVQKESKIIYVGRNLKDVCVSLWFHMDQAGGDFQDFAQAFKAGDLMPGNFPGHIKDGWERRHEPNICFVWYEDMKKDLASIIDKVSAFLGRPLLSSTEKAVFMDHLSIDSFRANTAVNKQHEIGENFIRKGVVGDHQNYFSHQMEVDWDEWLKTEFEHCDIDMTCTHS